MHTGFCLCYTSSSFLFSLVVEGQSMGLSMSDINADEQNCSIGTFIPNSLVVQCLMALQSLSSTALTFSLLFAGQHLSKGIVTSLPLIIARLQLISISSSGFTSRLHEFFQINPTASQRKVRRVSRVSVT